MNTCHPWVTENELSQNYHDNEWGKPCHDDNTLFEFLVLEGMQAGLSWSLILKRREAMRSAFFDFNPKHLAKCDHEKQCNTWLKNPNLIRNKGKLKSVINNARAFLNVQKEHQSFGQFIWQYVNHKPIYNHITESKNTPCESSISHQMSKDLKKLGFNFVGPKICYSFMQAMGLVNDHLHTCPLSKKIIN